jgi:hypothetical protein
VVPVFPGERIGERGVGGAGNGDRRVEERIGRSQPFLEHGAVDEWLERRAGLAARLHGAIELGVREVIADEKPLSLGFGRLERVVR